MKLNKSDLSTNCYNRDLELPIGLNIFALFLDCFFLCSLRVALKFETNSQTARALKFLPQNQLFFKTLILNN